MKNTHLTAGAILVLLSTIGGKGCIDIAGNNWTYAPPTPDEPAKPFCMIDPPRGCEAFCIDAQTVGFTAECTNPGEGPITAQFVENVREDLHIAAADGTDICLRPGVEYGQMAVDDGIVITPCALGYPSQVLKSESLDVCTPPPPWC